MLLRQPSPSVDSQGVCISYQETYRCIMVSGMRCCALECVNDNKKGYFCHSFFLVCCDSAKKLRSVNSAEIQVFSVCCGLGSRSFPDYRRASVVSCFGWAQLHPASWFPLWRYIRLNWSCTVLVGSPHKTSQRGLLPHLQDLHR